MHVVQNQGESLHPNGSGGEWSQKKNRMKRVVGQNTGQKEKPLLIYITVSRLQKKPSVKGTKKKREKGGVRGP